MKIAAILLSFLFVSSQSFAQYAPVKFLKDSINSINKNSILEDIDEYRKCIVRNHVSPFTNIKRSDFFDELDKIKDSADKYDIDQLLIQLLKVNAMIGDEHTLILYESRDIFPFGCYWFDEGIFIVGSDAANKSLLKSRIIAINDLPISEVVDRFSALAPDKNTASIRYYVASSLSDPFLLHGLQITTSRTDVTYTMVNSGGDTVKIKPVATDRRQTKIKWMDDDFLRYSRKGSFWYKYEDSGQYIYFKYASCLDDREHPFRYVEKSLVEAIETKNPTKIIIDLRDNRGGYTKLLQPFINSLARSDLNKKGRIYVLLGRKTFSAGIIAAVTLKKQTYATLIGEETSGSTTFFAGVKYFQLPATRLTMQYSTNYWATDEKYDGSLRPDLLIPEKFADYVAGTDAALEYAITH
jgi:peptidase S41-like protein